MGRHEVFGGRKCLLATTATSALALLLYCCALWCRRPEAARSALSPGGDSFAVALDRERSSYDRLMRRILRPGAPCLDRRGVCGRRRGNGRLDGDKLLCLEPGPGIGQPCIVYSFGIAGDWSFDEEMVRRFGCSVHSFDPSLGVGDHLHSDGVHFYDLGIGEFDGTVRVEGRSWKIRSFDSILEQLGHRNETVDVLKMDIEGAEYVVLEDMLRKGLLNHVNHLCVELHLPDNPYWSRVLGLLDRIESESGLRHFSTRNNSQMPALRVPGFFARYEQHFFEMAFYRH